MYSLFTKILFFVVAIIAIQSIKSWCHFNQIETAAGNIGTIIQLNTSNAHGFNPNIRPVRQRGMYFNNPSWIR